MSTLHGKRHRCGGVLEARDLQLSIEESSGISMLYFVEGAVCGKCHEELIDRETALQLQASQTPTVAWNPAQGYTSSTQLDAIRFDPLTAATETVTR